MRSPVYSAGFWHRRHRQPPRAPNLRGANFRGRNIFSDNTIQYNN